MVLPASHRVSVRCGTQDTPLDVFASHTGLSPPLAAFPTAFCSRPHRSWKSYNPGIASGLGSSAFARHYSRNSFLLLRLLRCFSSPGSPPCGYCGFATVGFPIRISLGLASAHDSPTLFAVYHVLHRHLTPRHPPCALTCFVSCDTEKRFLSRFLRCLPASLHIV